MTKILFTNGCSWTAGHGIESDPIFKSVDNINREIHSWPSVLGNLLNYKTINHAHGGGSNERIVRTTCDFITSLSKDDYKDLLVVVGWTTLDRREIFLKEKNIEEWCNFNPSQQFSLLKKYVPFSKNLYDAVDIYQEKYISYVRHQKSNYAYYFQQMLLLSSLLENLNIKYMFFSSLPWFWDYGDHVNPNKEFPTYMTALKKPEILNFRDCDNSLNIMLDFCNKNNIPFAPDHHTMTEGHRRWANHLKNELTNLYKDQL